MWSVCVFQTIGPPLAVDLYSRIHGLFSSLKTADEKSLTISIGRLLAGLSSNDWKARSFSSLDWL
jgi:hypothetical protein